jgi:hypothetical protein
MDGTRSAQPRTVPPCSLRRRRARAGPAPRDREVARHQATQADHTLPRAPREAAAVVIRNRGSQAVRAVHDTLGCRCTRP